MSDRTLMFVMPGLVQGIHVFRTCAEMKTWMAGTSPAMTIKFMSRHCEARSDEVIQFL